jgi:hypothetical protein
VVVFGSVIGPFTDAAWREAQQQRVASSVTNTSPPKFYAVAAMWMLNSRDDIRSAAANNPATHLDPRTTSGGASGPETPWHFGAGEVEVETSEH